MSSAAPISSCALASTAQESAFRIDYPLASARATRVVGLDAVAVEAVRAVADHPWAQAQFYACADPGLDLVTLTEQPRPLAAELEGVDSLIMVTATGENADALVSIGAACKVRGIMTAGLVLAPSHLTRAALIALRSYARILLVPADADDLFELLRAIRA